MHAVVDDITSMAEPPELWVLPNLILHLSTRVQFTLFKPRIKGGPSNICPCAPLTEQAAVRHTLCGAYGAILLLSMSWQLPVSGKIKG